MRLSSGFRNTRASESRRTSPSSATRPTAPRRSPAITSSREVFPAPEGPRTATAVPSSRADTFRSNWARGSRRSSSITSRPARSRLGQGAPAAASLEDLRRPDRGECDDDGQRHQPERRGVPPDLRAVEDREGERLGPSGNVARDENGGAELAKGPREGEQRAGQDASP